MISAWTSAARHLRFTMSNIVTLVGFGLHQYADDMQIYFANQIRILTRREFAPNVYVTGFSAWSNAEP
jgi:hypothetical protein